MVHFPTADFSAFSVNYINDFHGPCTLQVKGDGIIVKRSNGKEVGSWPYVIIREFRFDDEKLQFLFKSGRRGPFGVADYLFKLHNRTFYGLKETINRIAADRSGNSQEDYRPPVPPHAHDRKLSTGSNVTYDDLPTVRSLGHHRSASNPDLTRDVNFSRLLRKEHGSTRSSPSHPLPRSSPRPNSPHSSPKSTTPDYQVPKPATDVYNVPRMTNDPRNDYQIPRPMDETYMVPRPQPGHPYSESELHLRRNGKVSDRIIERSREFEHSYEDMDKLKGTVK
jgi:hypothetical protein